MRFLFVIALLTTACKHAPTTPTGEGSGSGSAVATKPATPYQTRRTAACKKLGPKMTSCALDDAKAALAKGEIKQKEFDEATKPEILAKNTEEATTECEKITTTFQLRVIEVCLDKETACGPLAECLSHLGDKQPDAPPGK